MPYKNTKEWTMIRIRKKTLTKLKKVKVHPNQSYDEILDTLIKELEK